MLRESICGLLGIGILQSLSPKNINLAEKNYSREKIQKLTDRREKCLQLMKTSVEKSFEPLKNPFSLTYDANPKLPFFIDALKLTENNKFGKHLITGRRRHCSHRRLLDGSSNQQLCCCMPELFECKQLSFDLVRWVPEW